MFDFEKFLTGPFYCVENVYASWCKKMYKSGKSVVTFGAAAKAIRKTIAERDKKSADHKEKT